MEVAPVAYHHNQYLFCFLEADRICRNGVGSTPEDNLITADALLCPAPLYAPFFGTHVTLNVSRGGQRPPRTRCRSTRSAASGVLQGSWFPGAHKACLLILGAGSVAVDKNKIRIGVGVGVGAE